MPSFYSLTYPSGNFKPSRGMSEETHWNRYCSVHNLPSSNVQISSAIQNNCFTQQLSFFLSSQKFVCPLSKGSNQVHKSRQLQMVFLAISIRLLWECYTSISSVCQKAQWWAYSKLSSQSTQHYFLIVDCYSEVCFEAFKAKCI